MLFCRLARDCPADQTQPGHTFVVSSDRVYFLDFECVASTRIVHTCATNSEVMRVSRIGQPVRGRITHESADGRNWYVVV
jgi:hypothetical protein